MYRLKDEIYTNLVIYRNELKGRNVPKYKFIGIISELILSKEIFNKNSELIDFVEVVFSVRFRPYVFKSRTILIAKITRIVYDCDDSYVYENIRKSLYNFTSKKIDILKENKSIIEKNTFDGWIK